MRQRVFNQESGMNEIVVTKPRREVLDNRWIVLISVCDVRDLNVTFRGF